MSDNSSNILKAVLASGVGVLASYLVYTQINIMKEKSSCVDSC